MLSYPIDEAQALLESKLKAAKTSLSNCEEDLDFIREQITVRNTRDSSPLFWKQTLTWWCAARRWRWLRRAYITGRLCKSGKKRRKRKIQKLLRSRKKSHRQDKNKNEYLNTMVVCFAVEHSELQLLALGAPLRLDGQRSFEQFCLLNVVKK